MPKQVAQQREVLMTAAGLTQESYERHKLNIPQIDIDAKKIESYSTDLAIAKDRAATSGESIKDAERPNLTELQQKSAAAAAVRDIAALALALGLSDIVESVSGGIRLDTIFIDEGFGSLDTENDGGTLDQVLQTLTDLASYDCGAARGS